MSALATLLQVKDIVLLDGGLATELERRGADLRDPLWSARLLLEDPDLIRQVHLDYFNAGADIVTSASYQASFEGFARRGLDRRQAAELMRLSVRLACAARDHFTNPKRERGDEETSLTRRVGKLVAASVGPYGAYRADGSEFRGDYGLSRRQLMDWHRPRLDVLIESGADLLACETIPCLVEAEALARLLEDCPLPAWLSFSCRDELHLCHGETFAEAAALAEDCRAIEAVGVNCTQPRLVEGLLRSAAGRTTKPLLAYPNSGENWDAAGRCWRTGAEPFDWVAGAKNWRVAGARLIGGCCRTTPDTIALLARNLSALVASRLEL